MKFCAIFLFPLFTGVYSELCQIVISGDEIKAIPEDGTLEEIYEAKDVTDIKIKSEDKYFQIILNKNNVTITLQNMKEYHSHEPSSPNLKTFDLTLELTCTNLTKHEQTIFIVWQFSNVFPPVLNSGEDSIKYQLPMPFPNINLGLLTPITITDIDMYNTDINVKLNEKNQFNLAVNQIGGSKGKQFDISLTPNGFIQDSVTLNLLVEDVPAEGKKPKSLPIQIIIEKLSSSSIPVFEKASHSGVLKIDILELSQIETKITYTESTTFDLDGDQDVHNCFISKPNKKLTAVSIELDAHNVKCNIAKLYESHIVTLTLNARVNNKIMAWTAINVDIIAMHFEQNAYVYEYAGVDFMLTDIKLLDVAERADIDLESDDLDCSFQDGQDAIKCTLKEELSSSRLETKITALVKSKPESAVTTTVVIYLSEVSTPAFEKASYRGNLKLDIGKLSVINAKITFTKLTTFALDGDQDLHNCFTPDANKELTAVSIKLDKSNCKVAKLYESEVVTMTLKAKEDGKFIAETVIIVDIIAKYFEKNTYVYEYTGVDFKSTDIKLLDVAEGADIGLESDDLNCSFQGVQDAIKCTLKEELTSSRLETEIAALVKDKPESAVTTSVVIYLSEASTPAFEKSSYRGNLKLDIGKLSAINAKITFTKLTTFALDGDQDLHNCFTPDANKELTAVSIKLDKSNCKVAKLYESEVVTMTLKAKEDEKFIAETVIIVDIIAKYFEKNAYVYEYTGVDFKSTDIKLLDVAEGADIGLESDDLDCSFQSGQDAIKCTLKEELTSSRLETEIAALAKDKPESAITTSVVIYLSEESMPAFEKTSYRGNLKLDIEKLSAIDAKITFTKLTTFALDGDQNLHNCFTPDANKELTAVSIKLDKTNCNVAKLYESEVVTMTLKAKKDGKFIANTAIIVDIIAKYFEKSAYIYEYTGVDFEMTDVKLLDVSKGADIGLESDDLYCSFQNDHGEIKCTLKEEITSSPLKTKITALVQGIPESSVVTSVVIYSSADSMPAFEAACYSGTLKLDILEFSAIEARITFSEHTNFELDVDDDFHNCFFSERNQEFTAVSIKLDDTQCNVGKLYETKVVTMTLNAKENEKLVTWTAITIEIVAKHFEKNAYVYEYTGVGFELTNIKLLDVVNGANIILESNDLDCTLQSDREEIKCILNEELTQSTLETEIKALIQNRPDSVVTTNVVIYSSSCIVEEVMQFTEVIYQGVVNLNKKVTFNTSKPELQNVIGEPKFEVDKYKDVFGFKWVNKAIEITINEIPNNLNVATFTLTATSDQSNEKAYATILLNIEHKIPTEYDIKFAEPLYSGELYKDTSHNWQISINSEKIIKIISDHGNASVFIDEEDPHKPNFKIMKIEDKTYELVIADNSDFIDETMISFTLFATAGDDSGYTVVALVVSQTPEIPTRITFEEYQIAHDKIQTETTNWKVVQIKAISKKDKEFNYKTKGKNCPPEVEIHESGGLVQVKGILAIGTHICNIIATGTISKAIAETPLVLVVFKKESIPTAEYQAEFSHVVIYLNEDQLEDQIVLKKPGLQEEYGYCIKNSIPLIVDNPDIFYVKDGTVLARKFQLETEEFKNMIVPQFTVTVKTVKLDDIGDDGQCPPLKYKRSIEGIVMEHANTLTSPKETIVSVIINDVNNNAPEMEQFRTVGYPNKDLVDLIHPRYLTKLHATDKDSKESGFGEVTYASLSLDQIVVNPTTGEVYPTNAMYDDDTHKYTVQACDPDPNHCVEMTLEVILLSSELMATLVVEMHINELENWLEKVSEENDVTVSALSVGTVYDTTPAVIINPFLRENTTPRYIITALIYALNKTSNTPLKTNELQVLFTDQEIIEITDPVLNSEEQGGASSSKNSSYDDTGLIVAVTILGVLLIGTLLGGAYFIHRMKNKQNKASQEIKFSKSLYSGDLYKDDNSKWKISFHDNDVISITATHWNVSVIINENDPYQSKFHIKKINDNTFEMIAVDYEDFSKESLISFTLFAKAENALGFTMIKLAVSEKLPEITSQKVIVQEEKKDNMLDKIQFVKNSRPTDSPLKSTGRRDTGYPLNAPSIALIMEMEDDAKVIQTTLAPYESTTDDDAASSMTETTSKSVKFNSESKRIEISKEDHDSD